MIALESHLASEVAALKSRLAPKVHAMESRPEVRGNITEDRLVSSKGNIKGDRMGIKYRLVVVLWMERISTKVNGMGRSRKQSWAMESGELKAILMAKLVRRDVEASRLIALWVCLGEVIYSLSVMSQNPGVR